jgi:tetratricopeptide (TPR) repeat protein
MLVIVPRARESVLRELIATDRTALSLLAQFESEQSSDDSKVTLARAARDLCLSNPALARCRVTALGLAGAHEEALAWLDEAEKQFPDQSWVPAMRAETLLEQGRVPEAAQASTAALAKNRDDWLARLSLSQAYQEQQRWSLAFRHLRMALGVAYGEVHVQYQLARLLQMCELWDAAAEHYEATVEFAPDLLPPLIGLITVYLRRQRCNEAMALLPRAEQLADDHAYAWDGLARAYGQLGNLGEARRCFDRAVSLQLDDPATRTYLAELLLARGETAEAITELEQATRRSEDSARAWFALGRALWWAGRMPEALIPLERAAALAPHDGAVQHHLGRLYAHTGRLEDASLCLSEALRACPHDGEIQRELISVYQQQRRNSRSHFYFRDALPEERKSPRSEGTRM